MKFTDRLQCHSSFKEMALRTTHSMKITNCYLQSMEEVPDCDLVLEGLQGVVQIDGYKYLWYGVVMISLAMTQIANET